MKERNFSEEISLKVEALSLIDAEFVKFKMVKIFDYVSFLNSRNIFDEPLRVFYCCEFVIFTHIKNNWHVFDIFDWYFWDTVGVVFEIIGVIPPPILSIIIKLLESCSIKDLSEMDHLPGGSSI